MRVTVIDNYDSFVYNVAQYLGALGAEVDVVRNDVDVDSVRDAAPDALVISPGPGRPSDAGSSVSLIRAMAPETPILGICLGHQAIGEAFGADIIKAPELMHGRTSRISHDGSGVFAGLQEDFEATRYHSLVIDPKTLPADLVVTATADGVIMGVTHRTFDRVTGVQFHPESVLTQDGMALIENFLRAVPSGVH